MQIKRMQITAALVVVKQSIKVGLFSLWWRLIEMMLYRNLQTRGWICPD